VDRIALATLLHRSPETIRTWTRRGYVRRVGVDERGRVLYSVGDAARQALRADKWLGVVREYR